MAVIQDRLYPFKVWLATIIAGSIVFTLYDTIVQSGRNIGDFLGQLTTLLLFNIILSLPGLLIYFLGFEWLNTSQMPIVRKRWALVLLAFSLLLITWYAINAMFERDVFLSAKSIFIYFEFLICIIVSSFVFGRSTAPNTCLPKAAKH
jgi:uncharacterized membrane protein